MANPVPLDFRFPGIFNLNQTPKLPDKFGPPDMSGMLQSSLSAMADPIVSRMKEEQAKTSAKTFYEQLASLSQQNAPLTTPSSTTGSTAAPGTGPQASADIHAPLQTANSEVRDTFMNTMKTGGLTNPYGLAAFAATGQAETGWSPGKVNAAWNDLGKPSGGTLSWRAERLQAMREFTRGAEDPVIAQAQFALKENPQLIAALNAAKSPEEANRLMANAWRYKGFNGGDEYHKRLALTQQYASQMAPAQAPQLAPAASFAPQVAPAPTPAAAAAVTAPAAPQQAPQQPQPQGPTAADYQKEIYAALNRGDKQKATELAAERDMVAAQQKGVQPQQAQGAAPGPQSQQAAPEQKQEAQQQQVIQTVGAATQQNADRLDGMRQEGERVRVASISPQLPGLGLGGTMPGAQPQPQPQPQSPAMGEPSFFSPQPMVPPQLTARPATPAPSAPAAAPAGTTAGQGGLPPPPPAVAPSPVQVAQAQGLPPVVSAEQRMRPITDAQARALFAAASTPEQYALAAKIVMESRLPQAPTPNRFKIENGHWIDTLTGQTKPLEAGGMFAGNSLEGQALNHLVSTGQLTRDQAAQVAAGKKVTGADGADYWFRPQDLAGGPAGPTIVRQPGTGGGAAPAPPAAPGTAAPAPAAPDGPRQLTPPKADKPDNVPAEVGARIGLGNTFLEALPNIRKQVAAGALDSPKARAQLVSGYGEPGDIKRQIQSGKDALLRGLTGAGMGIQEAKEYVERYEPSWRDDRRNITSKLDGLERDLKGVREGVLSGRRITDPALRGREGQSGGGFTTPGGTFFKEVR